MAGAVVKIEVKNSPPIKEPTTLIFSDIDNSFSIKSSLEIAIARTILNIIMAESLMACLIF